MKYKLKSDEIFGYEYQYGVMLITITRFFHVYIIDENTEVKINLKHQCVYLCVQKKILCECGCARVLSRACPHVCV